MEKGNDGDEEEGKEELEEAAGRTRGPSEPGAAEGVPNVSDDVERDEQTPASPKRPSHTTAWRKKKREARKELEKYFELPHDPITFADGSDLDDFIREIDRMAKFPNPGYEPDAWRAKLLSEGKIRDVANRIDEHLSRLGQCSKDVDLVVVDCEEELRAHFEEPTRLPAFIAGTSRYGKTLWKGEEAPAIHSIATFLEMVGPERSVSVQVLDKPKDPQNEFIVADAWTTEKVRKVFLENGVGEDRPINCLDLALPAYLVRHTPTALAQLDALRMSSQAAGSAGRGDNLGGRKSLEQFFLLSKRGSISATHVDAGGVSTWIQVLEGEKVWYYGRGLLNMPQADREPFFEQSVMDLGGYQHGWTKIHLRRGDIFVMPPGMDHAVYTPSDCLCVGGFVLAAVDVPNSLRIVRHLQWHPHLTNDDPPRQMFKVYEGYYEHQVRCGRVGIERMQDLLFAFERFVDGEPPSVKDYEHPTAEERKWIEEWKRFVTTAKARKGIMADLRTRVGRT